MTRRKVRFLSNTVTLVLSIFTTVVVLVCCALLSALFYVTLDERAVEELSHQAHALLEVVEEDTSVNDTKHLVSSASQLMPTDIRATLIGADGTVIFDSTQEEQHMPNHLDRPEIIEAKEHGEGTLVRFSETSQRETIYYSVLLDNETIMRVSTTQESVLGIMTGMLIPCLVLIICVVVCSSIAGRIVARSISSSVQNINLDKPFNNDTYEEIVPLLVRVNDQRKRLDAQATERRAFTANVSHELKTPLTVISGYAELISKGIAKPEDVTHFSTLIYDESRRMKGMVDDLIELAHLDDIGGQRMEVELTPGIDFTTIVQEIMRRTEPLAEEYGIQVAFIAGSNEPHLLTGNRRILGELVGNLVENAIRYNKPDGYVHIGLFEKEDTLILQVSDSGVGIPAELRERVFERFFRVDVSRSKETGGSGLGLAIVKHAANLHNATASIEDNVPQGTVVSVSFPR